jgi:hypothetical protein
MAVFRPRDFSGISFTFVVCHFLVSLKISNFSSMSRSPCKFRSGPAIDCHVVRLSASSLPLSAQHNLQSLSTKGKSKRIFLIPKPAASSAVQFLVISSFFTSPTVSPTTLWCPRRPLSLLACSFRLQVPQDSSSLYVLSSPFPPNVCTPLT